MHSVGFHQSKSAKIGACISLLFLPMQNKECEQCSEVLSQCKIVRKESDQLRETLGQLVTMNQRLRDSNLLLQAKCEGLLEDLSIKEARWTEREEALKNEVRINGSKMMLIFIVVN